MKYMRQFGVIMFVTCIGEILKHLIPLPIPSSIYGLCLMMILLITKVIKVENVKETGTFLIEIMPLMFIAAGVGVIVYWEQLRKMLIPVAIITVVSTILVMAVSGRVAQYFIRRKRKNQK